MEILRSLRLEVDHAIVTYRGSVNSSYPLSVESALLPAIRKKTKEKVIISNRHDGELSLAAYKRLRRAVSWLEHIADEKEAAENWKCVFLTLTVPEFGGGLSEGILKKILNVFLTWLRRSQGVKSYVWKAELTKKGKLHYHLLTDVYLDELACRDHWNSLLLGNGLLDRYKQKFSEMSLIQYLDHRCLNEGEPENEFEYEKRVRAYNFGVMSDWSSPRSTQLDIVPSSDSLERYLSKYLGKSVGSSDDVKLTGRIWGCSRNLSEKNVCRVQIDPMTKDVEVLHELLSVATGCEDIEFEIDGVTKVIGYRISFNRDIWFCDPSSSRLSQILSGYIKSMREGVYRYDYQQVIKRRNIASCLNKIDQCAVIQDVKNDCIQCQQLMLF